MNVSLTPELAAFVHMHVQSGMYHSASEVVREGQTIQAKVLEVDEDRRRISLSIKALTTSPDYTGATGETAESAEPETPPRPRKTPRKGGLDSGFTGLGDLKL